MSIAALNVKQKLAGNPKNALLFSRSLKLKDQNTIDLACPDATRAMTACMDMHAVLGGAASHYGGPAAFAELMSATYALAFYEAKKQNKEFYELFHIINDAGHCENGLYALKANYGQAGLSIDSLKHFRSIKSKLTGHGESHLFPEGVYLSNGPLGSALPQSQGLAMADALAQIPRVCITAISDGAAMEGEAKEAFTAIPGLAAKNLLAPFICILSDNNTKLSGRIDQDSFDMNPYFLSLETAGWHRIYLENGNDLQACLDSLQTALELVRANPRKPVLIHAKTVKGIGTKKTVESKSGGHGFPLSKAAELPAFVEEIYSGKTIPKEIAEWAKEIANLAAPTAAAKTSDIPSEKIQVGVANALIKKAKENFPVVSISADLQSSTGVAAFAKEFPKQAFDIGVAEANMISVAAGFSKQGFIPVVDTFAQFGVTKGALPITMANLSHAPIIAIFSHTGFQDAADGASHQALSYIAMLSSIPDVKLFCLSCSSEAEALIAQAIEEFAQARKNNQTPSSYVFFLGRENFPRTFVTEQKYKLGEAQIVFDNTKVSNKKVCLIAVGSTLVQSLKAAQELENKGIACKLVNASSINHVDKNTIFKAIADCQNNLVIVEDHQRIGGFSSILSQELCQNAIAAKLITLAVDCKFGQSAYTANELYAKHGLDDQAIVKAASSFFM